MESSHRLTVKLDGKNYFLWSSYFRNFLEGQGIWGYVDGTTKRPEGDASKWIINNAKIKTWIMESVDQSIAANLSPLTTAKDMWNYLCRIFKQNNEARLYHLEHEVSTLSQGSYTVQEFYSSMMMIWKEMDMIESDIPAPVLETIVKIRQKSRSRQFLMKMRSEFEHVRASIINRGGDKTLDMILPELIAEETRLASLSASTHVPKMAFFASSHQGKERDLSRVKCYPCYEMGHLANRCKNK